MLNITIYDVIANHELSNQYILKEVGILKMNSYLELRRARWLEKLSHMKSNEIPRLLLEAWLQKPRRNGQAVRAQHTNKHGYERTPLNLGFFLTIYVFLIG